MVANQFVIATGSILKANDAPASAEMYDPATDTWRILAKLLRPRAFLSSCGLGEKFVYIFGGRDAASGLPLNAMERLEISGIAGPNWNNEWERVDLSGVPPYISPRETTGMC